MPGIISFDGTYHVSSVQLFRDFLLEKVAAQHHSALICAILVGERIQLPSVRLSLRLCTEFPLEKKAKHRRTSSQDKVVDINITKRSISWLYCCHLADFESSNSEVQLTALVARANHLVL
jgi:hypothetical protein